MYDSVNKVFDIGLGVIQKIQETQCEKIDAAGRLIAQTHLSGHKFFVTGSGHSHTVAEEFYGRAGGLAFPVPIMTTELTLEEHPTKSSYIERLPGYAAILGELYGVGEGDVVLITSNSGRNAYPVEMALYAKEHGAKVIAITNMKHTLSTTSRHSSGKRLFEVSDVVIDNCGEIGDASTSIEGYEAKICPTSSIANAVICSCINGEVCECLRQMGCEVEVFISANLDGGFEKNEEYFKKYTRLF